MNNVLARKKMHMTDIHWSHEALAILYVPVILVLHYIG